MQYDVTLNSPLGRRRIIGIAGALALAAAFPRLSFSASAAKPKIGMIGAGRMGGALGSALVRAGYQVMFSSRNPDELKGLVAGLGANAQAGTVEQAAAFGDVVVLVVPYGAMPAIAAQVGPVLARKPLLLDVSNPIPQRDGEAAVTALEEGPAEYLSRLMPGVKIVRGFNSTSFTRFANPLLPSGATPGVAMVGEDAAALDFAQNLARDIGFEPVVIGPLKLGKYLYRPSTYFNGGQTADEIRAITRTVGR